MEQCWLRINQLRAVDQRRRACGTLRAQDTRDPRSRRRSRIARIDTNELKAGWWPHQAMAGAWHHDGEPGHLWAREDHS